MGVLSLTLFSFLCSLLIVIFIFASEASAQPIPVKYFCDKDNDSGNYTTNSAYHTNLNTLLSNLTSNTQINYGFYNLSYGENTDKVYAIGMCKGDIKTDMCRSCLNKAKTNLTQLCPNRKEAIGWYDDETCMLRYSSRSIFGLMEIGPAYDVWNRNNATNANQFNKDVKNLMESLTSRAASSGDSHSKYATNTAIGPNNQTIYGLVQCTPDLSGTDCSACLHQSMTVDIPNCCNNKIGARIVRPSCLLRYESGYKFYDGPTVTPDAAPPPPPPPSTTNSSSEGKSDTSKIAIVVAVPIVVVVVVVLSIIFVCLRVRKPRRSFETQANDDDDDRDEITIVESLQFDFNTIRDATDNFSGSNKLGQGGFGAVYKGKLSNGQEVAVKRLAMDSSQGDIEFKNEVLLVAKLQHRNLVRLLGFCLEGRERLLIYEFVPNKSLDNFIFDLARRAQLNWESRYKIIGGIARGILYLHEDSRLRIIHRDLKANNILLDEEMNPKIADFGMARLFLVDQTQGDTDRIAGTYGYMAPEYALYGQFSVKSDVFSFGVLVLEIISGRKNSIRHGETIAEALLSFAWKNWNAGTATNIVDPTLKNDSESEIMRCIHIALLCVQDDVASRPTMGAIVLMLSSYSVSLTVPSEPSSIVDRGTRFLPDMQPWEYNSGTTRSSDSTNRSAPGSINEASITELYPR